MTSLEEKRLLLSEAMGFLDDDLIAEAHGEAVGKSLDKVLHQRLMKNIGLVACIVLIALCIPRLAQWSGMEVSGDMAPPQNEEVGNSKNDFEGVFDGAGDVLNGNTYGDPEQFNGVGCVVQGTYGSLSFVSMTDSTITLRMTLTQDAKTPIYIYFYDYAGVNATTQPNYTNNGVVIRGGRLKVTVNGEAIDDSLPTTAGTYDIVVDFSSLLKDDIPMRPEFRVTGFPKLIL